MKYDYIAISIVTLILLIYTMFAALNVQHGLVMLIFSISPIFVIWMVWVVLRYGVYKGPELKAGEEFGYADMQ